MSRRPAALDELADLRADSALRTLANLDSLEPRPALDHAVLARAGAAARTPRATGARRSLRLRPALRCGFAVAIAAAALCAVAVHRMVVSGAPHLRISAAPAFIETAVSARAIRGPPRRDAAPSPQQALPPQLIDSIESVKPARFTLQPPLLQERPAVLPAASLRATSSPSRPAVPAGPRAAPASR